ncbi:MAG: apolipoprotein N-acyltransferase [Mycobacteriales bacterium]
MRVLVTGQCLGQAADGLAQIAFAQFVVFEAGKGATAGRIASLLAVTLLPFSLVGPWAGVLIDRWPRRRVLVVMSLLRAALTLGALGTVVVGSRPAAFAGVLLLLSTSRFVLAAKGAALPRTVAAQELVTGNAISSGAGMSASFLGAVGGAAFVGRSSAAGFVVASLLYLAAASVFVRLPDVGGGDGRDVLTRVRRAVADIGDGIRVVARTPQIGRPLAAVWAHRLLLGAGFVLLILVADSHFRLRIAGYGLALAVTGVAAFVGTAVAPVCARHWRPSALLPVAFVPPAVAAYVGGVAPNLVVLVTGLAVTGLSFQLLKVLVDALVGGASPDAVRGRVFAVYDVLYNVAFVAAGLLMVPLWHPDRARALLWLIAAAFTGCWLVFARLLSTWPFTGHPGARAPGRRPWGRVGALVTGGLPVLAFPSPSLWWLAWVVLVPMLLVIRQAPTDREGAIRAWWAGAGFIVATGYWLLPVTGPALAVVAAGLGLLWLPWGWAAHRMLSGRPSPPVLLGALLVLPAGWIAIEALRSWQTLGGPWALLGASQWNEPELLASAALGGVWLTGFLVVLVNTAVVVLLTSGHKGVRVVAATSALCALAVGPLWAAWRPALPTEKFIRVAVVQPGVMSGPAPRLARQLALTTALRDRHPDLVVWGESSVGYDLTSHPQVMTQLLALSRDLSTDLLVNVDARRSGGSGIFKSSVLITPAGIAGSYDKTRLVPFGEYIPARQLLGWFTQVSKAAKEDRRRGHGPVVLDAQQVAFGPLICFESTFPDMARRQVALGAQLLVYQTASSTFQGTWAQPQHASLAAVRAAETGRPVVHVALTGTTAAFDATGHRLLWVDPGHNGSTVISITLTRGRTPYDVAGDWVLALSAGVLGAAAVGASLRGSRQPVNEPGRK